MRPRCAFTNTASKWKNGGLTGHEGKPTVLRSVRWASKKKMGSFIDQNLGFLLGFFSMSVTRNQAPLHFALGMEDQIRRCNQLRLGGWSLGFVKINSRTKTHCSFLLIIVCFSFSLQSTPNSWHDVQHSNIVCAHEVLKQSSLNLPRFLAQLFSGNHNCEDAPFVHWAGLWVSGPLCTGHQ